MQIPIVIYTHSDYFDVFKFNINSCIKLRILARDWLVTQFSDSTFLPDTVSMSGIQYHDNKSYGDRLLECLYNYKQELFLFIHEDFILYDVPNNDKLLEYYNIMEKNPQISFIRLLKTNEIADVKWGDTLYITNNKFAVQATLFRREWLEKFINSMPEDKRSIWDLEEYCELSKIPYFGLYHYNGENKRGLVHYDSNVFPYTATAIVKGKWNSEYKDELMKLNPDYDFSKRGWT